MNALVTGASGFTGAHLLNLLAAEGVEIFTHGLRPAAHGIHFNTPIWDLDALSKIIRQVKPSYVFHLAGLAVNHNINETYLVNVVYAATLLKAMEDAGQESTPILLVGTSAEYGMISSEQLPITEETPAHPYNHYGFSKLAQTQMGMLLAENGRPIVIVRPFNIIGTGMRNHLSVQNFARQVADIIQRRREPVISVGNLESGRDFIDVEDVVNAYWGLVRSQAGYGKIINICSGQVISMSDVLYRLIRLSGISIEVAAEQENIKPVDILKHYGDPSRLNAILGFRKPKNLDQSLAEILENLLAG